MRDGLTLLKTFSSEIEAQLLLNRLQALDIPTVLEKDNCGGMRPHMDISCGVDVLVADEFLEQAQAALDVPDVDPNAVAWTCPSCGEVIEPGFDACWKCGREK